VIAVVPCFNVKLVVLIVGSITILKLAVIVLLSATPVALLLGSVELLLGYYSSVVNSIRIHLVNVCCLGLLAAETVAV
jgi:hypothetical protein